MEAFEQQRDESKVFFATRSDYHELRAQLLQLILDNPTGFMQLVFNRELILWFSPPVGSSVLKEVSPALQWIAFTLHFIFVISAMIAMVRMAKDRPELFAFLVPALYMALVYGLVHAIRRYSYPFVPELCLFAAWWMGMLWWKWYPRRLEGERNDSN
jgi:hypothetical protein